MISIKDFERSDIEYILDEASKLENIAKSKEVCEELKGKILSLMFFEPSTRTKMSLGGPAGDDRPPDGQGEGAAAARKRLGKRLWLLVGRGTFRPEPLPGPNHRFSGIAGGDPV